MPSSRSQLSNDPTFFFFSRTLSFLSLQRDFEVLHRRCMRLFVEAVQEHHASMLHTKNYPRDAAALRHGASNFPQGPFRVSEPAACQWPREFNILDVLADDSAVAGIQTLQPSRARVPYRIDRIGRADASVRASFSVSFLVLVGHWVLASRLRN